MEQNWLMRVWRWLVEHGRIPIKLQNALAVGFVLVLVSFLLGRLNPIDEYADLQLTIDDLRTDFRLLAHSREDSERELRQLRLQERIDKQTIERLQAHSRELTRENLKQLEKEIFYKQLGLGARTKSPINIYALDATPDFRPGVRRFSAALVTPPRRTFEGSYYFEAVTEKEGAFQDQLIRVPKTDSVPLSVNIYADIEETVELENDIQIRKLRLVVLDKKGKQVADAVLEDEQDAEGLTSEEELTENGDGNS